jgi:hypothetical protein
MAHPILGAICITLGGLAAAPAPANDWPQFLGPTRNGASAETGLLASWPKAGPAELWKQEVGAGYAGPVVAGDWLILFHRVDGEEVVEGLEAATGKKKWKHHYETQYHDAFGKGDGPRATPLIAGDKVYTLGAEGRLTCLKLSSGEKVWVHDLRAEYKPRKGFFGVGTSPIVEDGRLLVNVGAKGAGIVAFNADDGKELWKATDQESSYSSPMAATIDGVRHVFFFTREGLVSLDPKEGTERFSLRFRSKLDASVNAAEGVQGEGAGVGAGKSLPRTARVGQRKVVRARWEDAGLLECEEVIGLRLFGRVVPFPFCVAVHAVKPSGAHTAQAIVEVILVERAVGDLLFKNAAAAFVAGALDVPLQFAVPAFVVVCHGTWTPLEQDWFTG